MIYGIGRLIGDGFRHDGLGDREHPLTYMADTLDRKFLVKTMDLDLSTPRASPLRPSSI